MALCNGEHDPTLVDHAAGLRRVRLIMPARLMRTMTPSAALNLCRRLLAWRLCACLLLIASVACTPWDLPLPPTPGATPVRAFATATAPPPGPAQTPLPAPAPPPTPTPFPEDRALWDARHVHFDRMDALDAHLLRLRVGGAISSDEAAFVCSAGPGWRAQMAAVTTYVKAFDPGFILRNPSLVTLIEQAERAWALLDQVALQVDCADFVDPEA